MKKLIVISLSSVLSIAAAGNLYAADTYKTLVDGKGNISLPKDYRSNWSFLGSYFVKNAPGEGMTEKAQPTFDTHTVFTQPESAKYYRKHGKFPDGAVLVKDVNGTNKETLTTGEAHYNDLDASKVVFVMVKDKKNRFANNAAWGEGWGWALFGAGETKSQTTNWKGEGFNNCFGCHIPVKDQDWVYTQGYKGVLGR